MYFSAFSFRPLILLSTLLSLVSSQQNVFYTPAPGSKIHDYSENPTYEIGDTVNLEWSTSYTRISLVMFQNDNADYEYLLKNVTTQNEYRWRVATNQNIEEGGNIFFLIIYDSTDPKGEDNFSSHYFNLTQNGSSNASETSAASSETSTSSTSTATPTPSSSSESEGLSTGAKVGLGVGIPIAVILAVAAVAWLFFSRRRRRRSNDAGVASGIVNPEIQDTQNGYQEQKKPMGPLAYAEAPGNTGLAAEFPGSTQLAAEVPINHEYHELPTESPRLSREEGPISR